MRQITLLSVDLHLPRRWERLLMRGHEYTTVYVAGTGPSDVWATTSNDVGINERGADVLCAPEYKPGTCLDA